MKRLLRDADKCLKKGPFSVTSKKHPHPSGDQHDFLSYGAYYWPNPGSQNGLPWVLRDGHRNPEATADWTQMRSMADSVEVLALAYYFTGREEYGKYAALRLCTWFVDKTTRMNPNAGYGKVIPGIRKGGYPVAGMAYRFRKIYDAADGSQPIEMKRVNNYDYHRAHLAVVLDLAQLADHFDDIDYRSHRTPGGTCLRKAVEFVIPFLTGKKKWPYFKKETFDIPAHSRWRLLRRAAVVFGEPRWEDAAASIAGDFFLHSILLTYPGAVVKNKKRSSQ